MPCPPPPPSPLLPTQAFRELQLQTSAMQQQLLQFAEEKVQLGQQANDLLTMHNEELERVGVQRDEGALRRGAKPRGGGGALHL